MTHGATRSVPTFYGGRSNERRSGSALVWPLYLPQKHRVPARVIHFHQQVSLGGTQEPHHGITTAVLPLATGMAINDRADITAITTVFTGPENIISTTGSESTPPSPPRG